MPLVLPPCPWFPGKEGKVHSQASRGNTGTWEALRCGHLDTRGSSTSPGGRAGGGTFCVKAVGLGSYECAHKNSLDQQMGIGG